MKMGSLGVKKISSSNWNNEAQKNYVDNLNTNNTGNYRKPFKPNLDDNNYNEMNKVEANKKKVNGDTNKNENSRVKNTNIDSNNTNNKLNSYNNKPNSYHEVDNDNDDDEDDRPAFPQGNNNNFENDEEDYDDAYEDYDGEDRKECPTCNRKFVPESYQKHVKTCKKVFVSKRKQFDSKKKRILDSEHAMMLRYQEVEDKKKGKLNPNNNVINKKNKWKKQSEEFRAILKANRIADEERGNNNNNKNSNMNLTNMNNTHNTNKKSGTNNKNNIVGGNGTGFINTPSVLTEDYKLCNMCNRKYNENAYDKHLPTCERKAKEAMIKGKGKPGVGSNTNNNGNKPNLNGKFKK